MPDVKYDEEMRERALGLYHEALAAGGASKSGTRRKIGTMSDINPATLHDWIRRAESKTRADKSTPEANKGAELA
ncbi:hypothetical protein [Corynebacterium liangguodongii]|uniref:Uncharacterized protein n=1 Tax=Corynebacterium liangguodongii TaxID=2079535 RepID=A0A2S0WD90_9CORY|nr:hypothetical protein [Corynebacterium liangguodongii]AWB83642.1 hypothetical protein C3E79_03360 [Corynebacterium liangguodongii]PWB99549.1 hypothetical protein DF219_06435 [Corynebacterium liangguodongii]